ncbi:MAG: response regulator [Proteobacteria bacterium]|nr:response regulator [Pseudomonadota bacterium]MBU1717316.1 response regulator [Pseudomonadota bacterium]
MDIPVLNELVEARILVVDDVELNAVILARHLAKKGYKAEICLSGHDCLKRVEQGAIDMVLLDLMMPGISGFDVLKKVREQFEPIELPIIMVTAVEDKEKIVEALGLGANDYLTKPVNYDIALARITTQLTALKFYRESLRIQKNSTVQAMVVTCNHEINNPLTVAMASIAMAIQNGDVSDLGQANAALKKIASIVRKIRGLTGDNLEETDYVVGTKMVKLKDD